MERLSTVWAGYVLVGTVVALGACSRTLADPPSEERATGGAARVDGGRGSTLLRAGAGGFAGAPAANGSGAAGAPAVGGSGTAGEAPVAGGGGRANAAGAAGAPPSSDRFVTVWRTDNEGISNDNEIELPLVEVGTYDFVVRWGDGTSDRITSWDSAARRHAYPRAGVYTVEIEGRISGWHFTEVWDEESGRTFQTSDTDRLIEIAQWGEFSLGSTGRQFYGASNLEITATDTPDLSPPTSLHETFGRVGFARAPSMASWDVSSVTDMSGMFSGAEAFNQDLSPWDVSSVTDMSGMFTRAKAFNQDLSSWDVSSVTNMSGMLGAPAFNQDLSSWDVSRVTDMHLMFNGADAFNQDLSSWDVSSVTDMSGMFVLTRAFNQDLSGWDVSGVGDMTEMFRGAVAFNQDLSSWDVSSVRYMYEMFRGAIAFDQDLSGWDVSGVLRMREMFRGAVAFNQDLSSWDVSSVSDMRWMFADALTFDQDLSGWDVELTYVDGLFEGVTLSTNNYDALLIAWAQQNVLAWVDFDGGHSRYSAGAAAAARQSLIDDHLWHITDGGQVR